MLRCCSLPKAGILQLIGRMRGHLYFNGVQAAVRQGVFHAPP
jgi:hypothetical protein